jgi:hypothetical protein
MPGRRTAGGQRPCARAQLRASHGQHGRWTPVSHIIIIACPVSPCASVRGDTAVAGPMHATNSFPVVPRPVRPTGRGAVSQVRYERDWFGP